MWYTQDGEFQRTIRHLIQLPKENVTSDDKSAGTEEREKHTTEEGGDDTEETQFQDSTLKRNEEKITRNGKQKTCATKRMYYWGSDSE